jgi:hypothetical protein
MSTKHLTATLATALAFSALTATAAQARPAGIDVQGSGPKVSTVAKVTTHQAVRTGTYTPVSPAQVAAAQSQQPTRTGSYTPVAPAQPVAAKAVDGTSYTLVAEMAGLVLLGIALIAFWASARSRRFRPLPH